MPPALLQRALPAALAVLAAVAVPGGWAAPVAGRDRAAAAAAAGDFANRAVFDALDRSWNRGRGNSDQTNDAPVYARLAWGESFFLQAYLLMYEATCDRGYLRKVVDHADRVLASRDEVRGVVDSRGRSLPAWRAGDPYTVGEAVLRDARGRPALVLRSALAAADSARATVAPAGPGRFTLTVTNRSERNRPRGPDGALAPAPIDTYAGLTMASGDADHAVARVNAAFSGSAVRVTAAAPTPRTGAPPATGVTAFTSLPYVFAVHTGQIAYPLARFARLVLEAPDLRRDAFFRSRAEAYLRAVERAVAVHDPEWRVDALGRGAYVVPRGAPTSFDGAEAPLNQSLALGRTLAELAAITGSGVHRERVRALARTFAGDLRAGPNGAATWGYAWSGGLLHRGWTAADGVSRHSPSFAGLQVPEDIDHGHIDVGFAASAVALGLADGALGEADLLQLAAAFTANVARADGDGRPTTAANVDGTGETGLRDLVAPLWMPLARWEPRILEHARAVYAARRPTATIPEVVLASAEMSAAANGAPCGSVPSAGPRRRGPPSAP
jgi:hypothetical protein